MPLLDTIFLHNMKVAVVRIGADMEVFPVTYTSMQNAVVHPQTAFITGMLPTGHIDSISTIGALFPLAALHESKDIFVRLPSLQGYMLARLQKAVTAIDGSAIPVTIISTSELLTRLGRPTATTPYPNADELRINLAHYIHARYLAMSAL